MTSYGKAFPSPLEKYLTGKRFARDAEVKQAVPSWLEAFVSFLLLVLPKPLCRGETNAYISVLTTLKSGVYHLLHNAVYMLKSGVYHLLHSAVYTLKSGVYHLLHSAVYTSKSE